MRIYSGMIAVRAATESDIAEIVRVVNAAFQVERDFRAGDRTSVEEVARLMANSVFLVAKRDDAIAGAVQVKVSGNTGYFGMLAVDPAQQRYGIGRTLLEAAENYCRGQGCHEITLHTGSIRTELFPYYGKFGYVITKIEPAPSEGSPFTKQFDIVYMAKPL